MKDPYLKPVILGGLFITLLSVIFAPGIFLWASIGGYITVRLAFKVTKEVVKLLDGLLLGLFTGIIGGTSLDILTLISFNTSENKQLLVKTLKKNWPKDVQIPNFNEILPTVFITTCFIIIIISIVFSTLGGYIGVLLSQKKKKTEA